MRQPQVSVLMPVYNAGKFIEEAINSILNQTFFDYEFIIIDDGSTDNSLAIIEGIKDPRIVFVRNGTNVGITETLNKGIAMARAELIARMDADDISQPARLQKQYDFMSAHPECALLSTWANVISEDKKFVRLERYRSNFYYYNLIFECWIYHPTIMFRKKMIEEVGMYSMPYSEDFDLFWKVSRKFKIANLAEALVDYRLASTSLNQVLRKNEYDEANRLNVLRNLRYYLGDVEIPEPVLECLRHNFDPALNELQAVDASLELLRKITAKVLETPNPNLRKEDIEAAHYYKRQFILDEITRRLSGRKAVDLISHGNWKPIYEKIRRGLGWRLKNIANTLSR